VLARSENEIAETAREIREHWPECSGPCPAMSRISRRCGVPPMPR
jgi:hypothetical protein